MQEGNKEDGPAPGARELRDRRGSSSVSLLLGLLFTVDLLETARTVSSLVLTSVCSFSFQNFTRKPGEIPCPPSV